MKINQQAPLIAKKDIFIQAPPQAIWKIHTDINAWSQWQPGITLSKLEGAPIVGAVFQWKSGGITINSTVQVVEPNERIGWTGKATGTQAKHIWTLKPDKSGTLLTTEESMDGWLINVLKVVMPKFLDESLDIWLQSLKKQAESVQQNYYQEVETI